MEPHWLLPFIFFSRNILSQCNAVTDVVEICSRHLGYTSVAYITFCGARWIQHTIHRILSASELCLDGFTPSLNRGPDTAWPLLVSPCHPACVQPFSSGRAPLLANTVTSLSAATAWHREPCIILDILVHLHTKAFKDQGAMILCQWSCRRAGLLLTPPAPLSTAQTSQGVKGTAGAVDGTRLDSERKEMGVKVGLQLAYHSLVNGGKAIDLMNHWMKSNLLPQEWTNKEAYMKIKRHLLHM